MSTSLPSSGEIHLGSAFDSTMKGNLLKSSNVPKNFDILPCPSIKCRIHPCVIFTVLDAYIRREEEQNYVIGTLMGVVSEGSIVDVTDCFVDRHSLTDAGLLQIIKDHHESMYELKQKVNPKEQVVGWFCTGSEMTELTCAVHGWFKSFSVVSKFQPTSPLLEPIHLIIDTTMGNNKLTVKTFLQAPMVLVKDACFQFQEIPMEIYTSQAEKAGLSVLLKSRTNNDNQTKDGFEASLDKLKTLLAKVTIYVQEVLNNRRKPDGDIGRLLMKTLCSESIFDPKKFENMCQTSLQDTLMVAYLSALARLQFAVAEKLNTSFF